MRRIQRKSPLSSARNWLKENKDQPGIIIQCPIKGRGIITTISRNKGDFLLHYDGEVLSADEGEKREAEGSSGFRFYFRIGEKQFCVDATKETGRLGRLVNHGNKKERNAVMKQIDGNLLLFILRDIEIGEEITYDYGIAELPWEKDNGLTVGNDHEATADLNDYAHPLNIDDHAAIDPANRGEPDLISGEAATYLHDNGELGICGKGAAVDLKYQGKPDITGSGDEKEEQDISGDERVVDPDEKGEHDISGDVAVTDLDEKGEHDLGGDKIAINQDEKTEPDISGDEAAVDQDDKEEPDRSDEKSAVDLDEFSDISSDEAVVDLDGQRRPDIIGNEVAFDLDNEGEHDICGGEAAVDLDKKEASDMSGDESAIDLNEKGEHDISGDEAVVDPEGKGEHDISVDEAAIDLDEKGEHVISGEEAVVDPDGKGEHVISVDEAAIDLDEKGEPDISGEESVVDLDGQGRPDIIGNEVAFDLDNEGEHDSSGDEAAVEPDNKKEHDPNGNLTAVDKDSKCTTVAFSGCFPNKGFFKLFDCFKLTEQIEDTDILIVPASEYGSTTYTSLKLFQSLLGRRVKILSKKWVKDSLMHGSVRDMSKYFVTSASNFGQWSDDEDYQPFTFQIVGKEWIDISEYMCVGKEWIFQSIVDGHIKLPSLQNNCEMVDSSGDESTKVKYQAFTPGKKIYIQTSGSVSGRRSQKQQCCFYCGELNKKISRHLGTQHASEIEVAKILSLPKKSKERKKAWAELEAKGNSLYNEKVLEAGTGMIIPKYRPAANKNEKKYLPCEYCRAYIVRSDLWKHHKTCVAKPDVLDDSSNDEDEDHGEDAGFRADNCQDNPTSAQHLHVQEHRKREQTELNSDSDEEWRPPSKKSRDYSSSDSEDNAKPPARKSKFSCTTRSSWTEAEKKIVLKAMKKNILLQKLPGKLQCEELLRKHEELRKRSWTMIKHFVRNQITAAKKHLRVDKALI